MQTITITDETALGDILHAIELEINESIISLEDLIRLRVTQEVEKYNAEKSEVFSGLVQPTESEKVLNGYSLKNKREIDAEEQVYRALDSFQKNGFFVIANERQVETLDERIPLLDKQQISFIKLSPLVGG